jgi:hypothetical protein
MEKYFGIAEVARAMGITPGSLQYQAKMGRIPWPTIVVGKLLKYTEAEAEEIRRWWGEDRKVNAGTPGPKPRKETA